MNPGERTVSETKTTGRVSEVLLLKDTVDEDAGVVDGGDGGWSTTKRPKSGLRGRWGGVDRCCAFTSATPSSRRQCRSSSAFGLRALHIDPDLRVRQGAAMEATQQRRFLGETRPEVCDDNRPVVRDGFVVDDRRAPPMTGLSVMPV